MTHLIKLYVMPTKIVRILISKPSGFFPYLEKSQMVSRHSVCGKSIIIKVNYKIMWLFLKPVTISCSVCYLSANLNLALTVLKYLKSIKDLFANIITTHRNIFLIIFEEQKGRVTLEVLIDYANVQLTAAVLYGQPKAFLRMLNNGFA